MAYGVCLLLAWLVMGRRSRRLRLYTIMNLRAVMTLLDLVVVMYHFRGVAWCLASMLKCCELHVVDRHMTRYISWSFRYCASSRVQFIFSTDSFFILDSIYFRIMSPTPVNHCKSRVPTSMHYSQQLRHSLHDPASPPSSDSKPDTTIHLSRNSTTAIWS